MLRFSIFRIPINVHWMFWLLAAFLGGAVGADTPEAWHRVLVFMVAAFGSILIHELGHALTGLKLGAQASEIQLHGMGGMAHFHNHRFNRKNRILMTAAGPGASILLAILATVLRSVFVSEDSIGSYSTYLVAYFLSVVVTINIFWSVINLMPILPMDGGQILFALLGPTRAKLTCIISFAALGVLGVLLWFYTRSLFNLVIVAFLASHTWKVFQSLDQRDNSTIDI